MSFWDQAFEWGLGKLESGYEYVSSGEIFTDAWERAEDWWEGEGGDKVITAGVTGMLGLDEQGRQRQPYKAPEFKRSRVQPAVAQMGQPTMQDMGYTPRALEYGQRAVNSNNRYIQDALNMVRPTIQLGQQTVDLASATLPQQKIGAKYAEQIS